MNEVLDEILTMLKTSMSSNITTFYKGEAVIVPKSYLPALMVYPVSTSIENTTSSTCEDRLRHTVTIKIYSNVQKHFDEDGVDETIEHLSELVELMEGRNSDNTYKADTVLGTLRNQSNISGTDFRYNDNLSFEYGVIQTGEWFITRAELTFTVDSIVSRPS
jgi:hypothetical protein